MRPPLVIALLGALALGAILLLPQRAPGPSPVPALSAPAITPELLAAEVETVRGLRFVTPLKFARVPAAELEMKVRAAMTAAVPPAESALRLRAAFALALIRPGMEFEAADCLAGAALEVPAAHYDAAAATMWVNDAFAPDTRPDLTARLVFHLARALLLQQPGSPALPAGNDDALLTAIALRYADAAITAQRHAQRHAGRALSGVTVPESSTYYASPPFLRAVLAFPAATPTAFHAVLRAQAPDPDTNVLLNRILARLPRTTAELLHPEIWPAPPVALPSLAREKLPPLTLLTQNTLGEFGARTLFKTQLTSDIAESSAAGLRADRYWLFAGAGQGTDHLLWRVRCSSAAAAAAFLRALAATHLGNAGITAAPHHFPTPDTFHATTPALTLRAAAGPEHLVTFAASPDPAVAAQLLAVP